MQCRWNLAARPSEKRCDAMRCRPFARSTQTTGPFGASVSTKSNLLGSSGPAAVAYIRRLASPHGATTRSRSHRTARYRLSAAHGTAVQAMACSVEAGRSFQAVCAEAFRACLAPIFLACNMARLKAAWQQHSTDACCGSANGALRSQTLRRTFVFRVINAGTVH
jgi:hypothetical protein